MDTTTIVATLDAEIGRLTTLRNAMSDYQGNEVATVTELPSPFALTTATGRKRMSAAARKRISESRKAWFANKRRAQK